MTPSRLLSVVQHTSADYLGLIEDHLEGRRIRFRYFRPFTEQGTIPQSTDICDGLMLLGGGPWGSAGARDVTIGLQPRRRWALQTHPRGSPRVRWAPMSWQMELQNGLAPTNPK